MQTEKENGSTLKHDEVGDFLRVHGKFCYKQGSAAPSVPDRDVGFSLLSFFFCLLSFSLWGSTEHLLRPLRRRLSDRVGSGEQRSRNI